MVICLCCAFLKANAQNSLPDSTNQINTSLTPLRYQNLTHRDPLVAFSLSFFPSGGQLYNRQYVKAAAILGVEAASAIVIFSPSGNKISLTEQQAVAFFAFMATTIFSFVDAPRSAVHLNNKYHLRQAKQEKSSFTTIQLSPGLVNSGTNYTIANVAFGLKLTIQ